jgi:serine/threonine protein kinase
MRFTFRKVSADSRVHAFGDPHSFFAWQWVLSGQLTCFSDFVLDLASNGELQSRISRMGSLSTACARYYTAQLVDALDYMHLRGVIHRCARVVGPLLPPC